jgi:hypothetical protein
MSAANVPAPSGSVIPEMTTARLIEYRGELLAEIASEYTAEVARTTRHCDFLDLKDYCRGRLNEVYDEIVKRFIVAQKQVDEMDALINYGNYN